MTFEAFKVKASFELEYPREIPRTVKEDQSTEGVLYRWVTVLCKPPVAHIKNGKTKSDLTLSRASRHSFSATTELGISVSSFLSFSPSSKSSHLSPKSSGSRLTQSLCVVLKPGLISLSQLGSFHIAVIDQGTGEGIHAHRNSPKELISSLTFPWARWC